MYNGTTGYFSNEQTSKATANELFTVGESGGDFSNILTGSSSGLLGPGTHSILASFGISALGAPTPTDSAVPEPGTLALMGLGLAALAFAGRRKNWIKSKL